MTLLPQLEVPVAATLSQGQSRDGDCTAAGTPAISRWLQSLETDTRHVSMQRRDDGGSCEMDVAPGECCQHVHIAVHTTETAPRQRH